MVGNLYAGLCLAARAARCKRVTKKHRWFESIIRHQNFTTSNVLANSTNIAASFRILVKNPVHASLIQLAEMTRSKRVKCESESHERYDCCSADNPVDGFDASHATTARRFTLRLCKRTMADEGSTANMDSRGR